MTQLLLAAEQGSASAADRLWATIYGELHRLARTQLAREGPACRLQTTSLVHEAYLRLIGKDPVEWSNRRHFFAAAAEAMRRILVDDARSRRRHKRGDGRRPEPLQDEPLAFSSDPAEVLAVDEALRKLEQADSCKAEVVMLRYFAGLSVDETAAALGVSPRTVDSDWRFAKAWLHRELRKGDSSFD